MLRATHTPGSGRRSRKVSNKGSFICQANGCTTLIGPYPQKYCQPCAYKRNIENKREYRRRHYHVDADAIQVQAEIKKFERRPSGRENAMALAMAEEAAKLPELKPGFCKHCRVIRLSKDDKGGLCFDCGKEVQNV